MSETADYSDLSIRRLELHGVGPFRDLVLDFPRKRVEDKDKAEVHIFVGENGTGKTTLLEAMTCFEGWYGGMNANDSGNSRNTASGMGRIRQKEWGRFSRFCLNIADTSIRNEVPYMNADLDKWFRDYFRIEEPSDVYHKYFFFSYQPNRMLESVFVSPGGDEFDPELLRDGLRWDKKAGDKPLFQWIMNSKTRSAFAMSRGAKKESDVYEADISRLTEAISIIVGRSVEFAIDEKRLRVVIKVVNDLLPVEGLPLGYRSALSWLSNLIYRLSKFPAGLNSRFTLFLDEIDIHLHPKAQRKILPVIQKLFPNAQIFITTHSPFVVGSVDGAWVYKFKLDAEGYSVLDGEPRLSEDADSYRTILEEVFDIHEQFGIEAQSKLDEFYKLRQEVLANGSDEKWLQFNELGRDLAGQSAEMHSYVSLELRQAARVLNRQLIA